MLNNVEYSTIFYLYFWIFIYDSIDVFLASIDSSNFACFLFSSPTYRTWDDYIPNDLPVACAHGESTRVSHMAETSPVPEFSQL